MPIFQKTKLRFKNVNNHLVKKPAYLQLSDHLPFYPTVAGAWRSTGGEANTLGEIACGKSASLCKQQALDLNQYEKRVSMILFLDVSSELALYCIL